MWLRYNFSKQKSLSHRFAFVISRETQWREISPPLTSHDSLLTISPLYYYTTILIHHSPLTTHHSPFTNHQNPLHYYTTIRLHQSTIHHSRLTTNFSLRPSRVLDTMALVYRHKSITRTDRNYLLVDSPQFTVISCQFTGLPVNQSTGSPQSDSAMRNLLIRASDSEMRNLFIPCKR